MSQEGSEVHGRPGGSDSLPSGPPWDAPLQDAPLIFVDLEMTGLEPSRDRVLQICVERIRGDELVDRLLSFVRPDTGDCGAHADVHGITDAELHDAPTFPELADRLLGILENGILVAHATRHDVAFLTAEFARIGHRWTCRHYLDTLALSRRAFRLPSHRLSALSEAFDLDNPRPHRADNDVAVLRGVFARVLTTLKPSTARDLYQIQCAKRLVRPEVIEAAKQALHHGEAVGIVYRSAARGPKKICFHITEIRTDLDPPMVLGYLQDTRGRRQLRADRILRIGPRDIE